MVVYENKGNGTSQKHKSPLLFIFLGLICIFILPLAIILVTSAATNTPTTKSVLASIDQTYDLDKDTWVGMPPVKNTYYDECDITKDGQTSTFTDKDYADDKGVVFNIKEAGNYTIKCHDTSNGDKYTPTAIKTGPKEAFIHPLADIFMTVGLVVAGISFLAGIALVIIGVLRKRKEKINTNSTSN